MNHIDVQITGSGYGQQITFSVNPLKPKGYRVQNGCWNCRYLRGDCSCGYGERRPRTVTAAIVMSLRTSGDDAFERFLRRRVNRAGICDRWRGDVEAGS